SPDVRPARRPCRSIARTRPRAKVKRLTIYVSEFGRLRIYQIIKQRLSGERPRSADLVQSDRASPRRFQRFEQLLHRHPSPEIGIYEPCPNSAVSPHNKCSWYRQHPGIVALIIRKHSTKRGQQSLKIGPDPDGKVKLQGVAVIHVD